MSRANLNDVVAFLAQGARNGPVAIDGDMEQDCSDTEVLDLGHDRRQVFLGAHDDHVADRVIPGQRRQVLADLGFDAFLPTRPGLAEPKLEAGNVGQRFVLGGPGAVGRGVVPVAAQQRQASTVPGQTAEQLQEARVVPGNRVTVASAMDSERAFG